MRAKVKRKSTAVHGVARRFYVASPLVMPGGRREHEWAKTTLAEAVAHARELCEKDGDDHYVVEVVRRVRRVKPQTSVENVR